MKSSYYFPHDYHARHDPKLSELLLDMGCEGVGIFWCLVEMLYEEHGSLNLDKIKIWSKLLFTTEEKIQKVLTNYGLFQKKDEIITSNTVNSRLKKIKDKRKKASISAYKRWDANAMRTQCERNAIKESKVKESKVKESKVKESKVKESKEEDKGFCVFWNSYPKKIGKEIAKKSFAKIAPDPELTAIMLIAIEKQKKIDQWIKDDGKFIPHPATWLNGRRWEDEISVRGSEEKSLLILDDRQKTRKTI